MIIHMISSSGSASIHPKENCIAVMNLHTGVDVWKIPSAIHDYSFEVKSPKGVLIPVIWIDKGARLLVGSDMGQVRVWNIVTKNSLPPLPHGESMATLAAIAAALNLAYSW